MAMRKYIEAIKIALSALWHNKLRSFLTMLGVAIGVFAVVTLVSVVSGLKSEIVKQVETLGADALFVTSGNFEESQSGFGASFSTLSNSITEEDVEALKDIDGVVGVSGVNNGFDLLEYGDTRIQTPLLGRDPIIFTTSLVTLEKGREFTQDEVELSSNKAIIMEALAESVFGDEDPLGKIVKLFGEDFEVIGIASIQSSSLFSTSGFDRSAILPSTTLRDKLEQNNFSAAYVKTTDSDTALRLVDAVSESMVERHDEKDFSVLTQDDVLDTIDNILGVVATALSVITAISLVVAGIGIMNIMLVSVTERTREIGLRKAIGATNVDILIQFIIEAILLSLLGGVSGLALAYLAGYGFTNATGFPTVISTTSILLAVGVSVAIGIIFGLLPAIRASLKRPIEALRYE